MDSLCRKRAEDKTLHNPDHHPSPGFKIVAVGTAQDKAPVFGGPVIRSMDSDRCLSMSAGVAGRLYH